MRMHLLSLFMLFLSAVAVADDSVISADDASIAINQQQPEDHSQVSLDAMLQAIATLAESQRQKQALIDTLQIQLAEIDAVAERTPLQQEIKNLREFNRELLDQINRPKK